MEKQTATAHACANIALIKYWGKRDEALFLPTKSSLSISLKQLQTTTTITRSPMAHDEILLDGNPAPDAFTHAIRDFLTYFRAAYRIRNYFIIKTHNSFPTSAGLASSASGFAALVKALDKLYTLRISPKELSICARQGSGSACRSIERGFVLWNKGDAPDGSDSYAEQLFAHDHWPELCVLAVVIHKRAKKTSSRVGMQQTVLTSPLYQQWLTDSQERLEPIIQAIKQKDILTVGSLAEADALQMHTCMRAGTPSLNYWAPQTKTLVHLIQQLRTSGIPAYVTIDAGPNLKILTLKKHKLFIFRHLLSQDRTLKIIPCTI